MSKTLILQFINHCFEQARLENDFEEVSRSHNFEELIYQELHINTSEIQNLAELESIDQDIFLNQV